MREARLQVTDTQGRRVVPLDRTPYSIGRRSGCDLQVIGADVSREHAEICAVDGAFVIRDRGSRFGTFVNGEAITGERRLTHGNRIRLGRTDTAELVFLTEAGQLASSILGDSRSGIPDLRQMAALLNGLRAIGSGRVLDEVLSTVMDLALEVTGAERGFVMLANASGQLEFKVARLKDGTLLAGRGFDTSRKIPEEVFRSGRTQVVPDLMDDSHADRHQGTIALGIRHVLCAPLRVHDTSDRQEHGWRVIGVLYLDGRERARMLSRSTQDALETFATEAALAIDSARLYADAAEKARLERDLMIASEIQQGLLPDPEYAGTSFDFAGTSIACRTIGGDFFDYMQLESGDFVFSLADVSGKGPPAALLATAVQSLAAAQAAVTTDPADALARINRALLRRSIQSRFATMFYGVLSQGGSLHYSSAGHEPPALVSRRGVESLDAGGLVLGLFSHATYETGVVRLEPGDLVVVCSDGITEARNAADEEFGRDRFVANVRGAHGLEPRSVIDRLLHEVHDFTAGAPQGDDVTVLALRYRG